MSDLGGDEVVPATSPNGLINIPHGSCVVHDAGEEIMELYMNLATMTTPSGGLGFLDPSSSMLEFDLVIAPPAPIHTASPRLEFSHAAGPRQVAESSKDVPASTTANGAPLSSLAAGDTLPAQSSKTAKLKGRSGRTKIDDRSNKVNRGREVVIPVKVQQDLNLLKGSKGDTAKHLLTQSHFPSPSSPSSPSPAFSSSAPHHPPPLLDPTLIRTSNILELGAGTGLLGTLLSPLCPFGTYTASDREENLKLLWRNLEVNGRVGPPGSPRNTRDKGLRREAMSPGKKSRALGGDRGHGQGSHTHDDRATGACTSSGTKADGFTYNVRVEEIDWVDISNSPSSSSRAPPSSSSSAPPTSPKSSPHRPHLPPVPESDLPDLVLAVDCIFNESLCEPLVRTLGRYLPVRVPVGGRQGCALVVVELRSADVLEHFLDTWLNDPSGGWTIVRLAEDAMGLWDGERPRWVGWVGWRSAA